jgi:riboflavin synthase alpha subunit
VSGPWFEVALIPTTLAITQLGRREEGWPLNVECDVLVKAVVETVERALAHREAGLKSGSSGDVPVLNDQDEAPAWAREGSS